MKKPKFIAGLLALTLSLSFILAGCSGSASSNSAAAASSAGSTAASSTAQAAQPKTFKLGVVGSVTEELWAPAKAKLAEEGITLEIVQFSDYVTPNNALANGDIDLNSFQHQIYLDSEIESNGYEIQAIGYTFIIPLNLYSTKVTSLEEIKDGDTIAIPNDPTNGGRALKVLESAGLITIKKDAGFSPTVGDIETYNKQIKITELAANTIPSALPDVTAGIINGNFALDFGLKAEEALYQDTNLSEDKYWNLIAARTADVKDPETAEALYKIVKAFQTDATKDVFNNDFGGYFIPAGWDRDLIHQ